MGGKAKGVCYLVGEGFACWFVKFPVFPLTISTTVVNLDNGHGSDELRVQYTIVTQYSTVVNLNMAQ